MLNNIDKNEIARKKYLEKWSLNATQHLEEGEYEWICSFIKEYVCILEIGCGTGDSTRVFATLGHKLLSIDNSDIAIKKAEGILEEYDFESLLVLKRQVDQEYFSREDAEPFILFPGIYSIGTDIKAGRYLQSLRRPERASGR